MAGTTNARSARFLPTSSSILWSQPLWAFASLSVLYGTLDSILSIACCPYENSSSPPHSILGNHIPARNIDRKFHHGLLTLVLEARLGSSNVTCALRVLHIFCILLTSAHSFREESWYTKNERHCDCCRNAHRQTDRQTDRQAGRQADRQTDACPCDLKGPCHTDWHSHKRLLKEFSS